MKDRYYFTDEQIAFVKEIVEGRYNQEITDMFNEKFGTNITRTQIVGLKARNKTVRKKTESKQLKRGSSA